MNWGQSK